MRKTIITALLDREKDDPSVNVDTVSNDSTGTSLVNPEIGEDNNVEGFVDKESNKIPVTKSFVISQVTPMTIMTSKSPDDKDIATVVLLCNDNISNETFNLVVNYYIENDIQKKIIESNPIHDNANFISKRLTANMIMNTLPCYITDMQFYYNKEAVNPNDQFYTFAVPNNNDTKEIVRFNMSAEIFSVVSFIDDYVASNSRSVHDLNIATVSGYKPSDMVVSVNFVDTIDSIISMAPSTNKSSTDVVVIFKIMEFEDASTKSIYKILTAFDFGKKFNKKKFRGVTMQSIEEAYGNDVDQYLSNYMIDTHINNLDKDYLIIKAKNKNGVCKLFFIDNDNIKKIEELVEAY